MEMPRDRSSGPIVVQADLTYDRACRPLMVSPASPIRQLTTEFDATSFHCTSKWLPFNRFPDLQLHDEEVSEMKTKRPKGTSRKVQTAKISAASSPDARRAVIEVERSGDWMPADELRAAALVVLAAGDDSALNLDGIDHLDASAMQILLARGTEKSRTPPAPVECVTEVASVV